MQTALPLMHAYQIWSSLPPELNHEILEAARLDNKKLYKILLDTMGQNLRRRVVMLQAMPRGQRHITFQAVLGQPQLQVMSQNLLMHWLVTRQSAMLCAFLDHLGIVHDGKGCADTFPETVPEDQLRKAVEDLYAKFDPARVTLYLSTFDVLSGQNWPTLAGLVRPL